MCGGCGGNFAYSLEAIRGEFALLDSAVPIEEALNDPTLNDEQRDKLAFIIRARDYAEGTIGLKVKDSYHKFANLHGKSLAWNLSGSKKDRLQPHVWTLPIVGKLPYLGYFEFDQAIAERDRLVGLGYDTVIYDVDAFSTLGVLPDPVTSALLRRDKVSLADTVMHELLHNTVYTQDSTFNESLATFVGRTAGQEFLQVELGPDAAILGQARRRYEDSDRLNAFLQQFVADLKVFYDSDLSSDEKIAGRAAIFQAASDRFAAEVLPQMTDPTRFQSFNPMPVSNAVLLLNVRYNDGLDVFQKIYDLAGRDWRQALAFFAQAADESDPMTHLQNLLNNQSGSAP